jgi:hypothetical protein
MSMHDNIRLKDIFFFFKFTSIHDIGNASWDTFNFKKTCISESLSCSGSHFVFNIGTELFFSGDKILYCDHVYVIVIYIYIFFGKTV